MALGNQIFPVIGNSADHAGGHFRGRQKRRTGVLSKLHLAGRFFNEFLAVFPHHHRIHMGRGK
jgi:hypothetical protein